MRRMALKCLILASLPVYGVAPAALAETAPVDKSDSAIIDQASREAVHFWARHNAIYHGLPTNISPESLPAPPELDRQGRPQWMEGPAGVRALQELASTLFRRRQFDDLERLYEDASKPDGVRMADGRYKIAAIGDGVTSNLFTDRPWDADVALFSEWRKKYPKSPHAALVEVGAWIEHAWDARGRSYASTVKQDQWKVFAERIDEAKKRLDASKKYAPSNPIWYDHAITIATTQQWDKPKLGELIDEAIRKHPASMQMYFSAVNALHPKWGGDWSLVERLARKAVKNTSGKEGLSYYARVYWAALSNVEPVSQSAASWPDMKQGFTDLMARYPHSAWNLNNFAAFACRWNDGETYLALRTRIGERIDPTAWQGKTTLAACDVKFANSAL